MNPTTILLRAYYETLYNFLVENKDHIEAAINKAVTAELKTLKPADFNTEKLDAYRDAAVAFLNERIETYNPIGVQYTFDHIPTHLAQQLELQLNWFDSTAEFEQLKKAAAGLAEPAMSNDRLKELANELIRRSGAFADKSIISAYHADPTLSKLPDYALATAIEELISF
jgi:hypothetical protein